jgi:DNA polymerase-3 subunit epsilon
MVRDQRIDEARVAALLADSVLIIAHNARFDRQVLERRFPAFADKHWGCSCDDIPWPHFDGQTRKLSLLLYSVCGLFHEGHRAGDDCLATVHLLAHPRDAEGKTPMAFLLEAARRKTHRLWAIRSPFETRETLKARGYKWYADKKTWYIDRAPEEVDAEYAWLRESVYGGTNPLPVQAVTFNAKDRYSIRSEPDVTWPSL